MLAVYFKNFISILKLFLFFFLNLRVHRVDFSTSSPKKIKKRKKEKSLNHISISDENEDDISIKKKRKLEKNHQPNVNDDNDNDDDDNNKINLSSINKTIKPKKNKENSLIENEKKSIEKKSINNGNLNETIETSLNITDENLNEDLNLQLTPTGKKKRKRTRKRKNNKIDNGIAATCNLIRSLGANISNSNSNNKMDYSKEVEIKKRKHIRFTSDPEDIPSEDICTISSNHTNYKSKVSANPMDVDVFASVMKKELSKDSLIVERACTNMNGEIQEFEQYPSITGDPKENMIIAFKVKFIFFILSNLLKYSWLNG